MTSLSVPLEDQAEFLATQWMSVKQLQEAGIPCCKGQFTKAETQKIHDAIQTYQKENNLEEEQLDDMIHSIECAKGFWSYVAHAVPQRGVKSVFYHVRHAQDSLGKVGKWSTAEDNQLRMAVQSHGKEWTAVTDLVQRTAADCSDRFSQHIQYKETKQKGTWSSDEQHQLVHTIEELARAGKSDVSTAGFWVSVSKAMGATWTPKQCQSKWSETLEGKARNEDQRQCWTEDNIYVLICKIASLDLNDESDIDWKSLGECLWNMWSAHSLWQKWRQLKASYNADGVMCQCGVVCHLITQVSVTRQVSTHIGGMSTPPLPSLSSTFSNA